MATFVVESNKSRTASAPAGPAEGLADLDRRAADLRAAAARAAALCDRLERGLALLAADAAAARTTVADLTDAEAHAAYRRREALKAQWQRLRRELRDLMIEAGWPAVLGAVGVYRLLPRRDQEAAEARYGPIADREGNGLIWRRLWPSERVEALDAAAEGCGLDPLRGFGWRPPKKAKVSGDSQLALPPAGVGEGR